MIIGFIKRLTTNSLYFYMQPSSHENPSTEEKNDFQAELVKGTYAQPVMITIIILLM